MEHNLFIFVMIIHQNKMFIWNCRGVAKSSFYHYCNQYMDTYNLDLVVVMEIRTNPSNLKASF